MKGTCATVRIGGAGNTINFDAIDTEINVAGANNTITYKAGDPKVTSTAGSNKDHQRLSALGPCAVPAGAVGEALRARH